MDKIPCVAWLYHVRERRHRSAVNAGHEDPIEILVRVTALKPRAGGKVIWTDWIVLAVSERRSGWTVPVTPRTVTLPAFHFLEELPPVQNAFDRDRRFSWDN